jgi:hypothetical protein
LLDSVITTERDSNIFFTDSTYFDIQISYSNNSKLSYLSICGTDTRRFYIETNYNSLVGFLKYKGHYFFVISKCPTLFSETKENQCFNVINDPEITEDDRWSIYDFVFDGENFFPVRPR